MAKLSAEEQATLDELTAKLEAPDEAAPGRVINYHVDLADETGVRNAVKAGLLPSDFLGGGEGEGDGEGKEGEGDGEPTPGRRGFFGS